MARKHEKFSWSGYKYAPESFRFYCNGKYINFDPEVKSRLAFLIISGRKKEAEDEMKRLLRNEEKQTNDVVAIAFYGQGSNNFYYTHQLAAHRRNLQELLYNYKEWKRFIQEECSGKLPSCIVTSGYITPYGQSKEDTCTDGIAIDFKRPGIIVQLLGYSKMKAFGV